MDREPQPDAATTARPRKVVLVPYDPEWPQHFERYAGRILEACHPWVTEIHHIGSTSVPGLPAKPIIDIMPGIRSYEDGFRCVEAMERLGYISMGELGLPRRHYFTDKTSFPAQNVHMYPIGEGQWHWHLAFRDHLRSHPGDRDRYFRLKTELGARHPWDVEAYARDKNDFIRSILRQYLELDEPMPPR